MGINVLPQKVIPNGIAETTSTCGMWYHDIIPQPRPGPREESKRVDRSDIIRETANTGLHLVHLPRPAGHEVVR